MEWLHSAISCIGILFLSLRITAQLIPQEYHFINQSMTWYEAQSYCRLKYTDLATINNMDDNNYLLNTLDSHVTYSWIGLQKGRTDRWMWSDGKGIVNFTNWGKGEPNNKGDDEGCGEVLKKNSWNDLSCEETVGFVCYESKQDGTVEYKYYSQKKSWVKSQDTCRTNHTDLASVTTQKDNSEIVSLATKMNVDSVWVGLFRDTWMWSDGRETSFRYWLRDLDKKNGNCSSFAVSQQGRWVPTQCSQEAPFVCHGGLKVKKMIIRIKTRSDVNLNDFTVSSNLLKVLEISLRNKNMTDFKLTWQNGEDGLVFQPQEKSSLKPSGP